MLEQFNNERIKKKIHDVMIFKKEDWKRARQFSQRPYTTVRLMPDEYASLLSINIYGNTVALIVLSDHPVGVLMRNKEIALAFHAYFDVLWKSCKEI